MKNRTQELRPTFHEHAAKVQLYRWYQLFERDFNEERINHQLDILEEDVKINSIFGHTEGRVNFPKLLPKLQQVIGAHHLRDIQVEDSGNGFTRVLAELTCQRVSLDGTEVSYSVKCKSELRQNEELLPRFTHLELTARSASRNEPFSDTYPVNRSRALVHYWLLLLEQLDNSAKTFKEILTDEFTLDLGDGVFITSLSELQDWLYSTHQPLKMSCHYPQNISVQQIVENKYELYLDFVWHRLTKENKRIKTITRQRWIVQDNPRERFAKIQWASVVSSKKEEIPKGEK